MRLRVNFLDFNLDYFPSNLVAVNEEQGEMLPQDIREIERLA
jgi:hypothetical protein